MPFFATPHGHHDRERHEWEEDAFLVYLERKEEEAHGRGEEGYGKEADCRWYEGSAGDGRGLGMADSRDRAVRLRSWGTASMVARVKEDSYSRCEGYEGCESGELRSVSQSLWSDMTDPSHAGDRNNILPLQDNISRTPEIRHLVFEYTAGKREHAVEDLQQRRGEGTKPREKNGDKG